MSEIQVRAKYRSLWSRLFLYAMLLTMPLWGVIAPGVIVVTLVFMFFAPNSISSTSFNFGWLGGLFVISTTSALASIALADDKLIVSKSGIRIPFHASLQTFFRRDFSWDDIQNVLLGGSLDAGARRFVLTFRCKNGETFRIHWSRLSEAEIEQVLLAIEIWAVSAQVDERMPLLKEQLQAKLAITDSKEQSYTAMWEEELERRFASTAFVVLEPDAVLKNGELQIVRQLSFGGLSAVYLCQQNKRELVVLKESVVPAGSSEELKAKAEELFAREAKFLMRLQHPNIVKVLDYFVEKGRNYLLLEHINGQDLKQYVRQHGPQPEYRVREWASKLAEVLQYLHSQEPPIIHRDLTPDNVVLDQALNLKIIDFGAANEFLGTATGTLIGKQSYLPMEQLRGKAVPQSDIYSFGSSLHFLLTGEEPEPLAVSHPKQLRGELSEQIDQLVASCTDPDYKNRPQSAGVLLDLLKDLSVLG
jgi:tRNA A-37 threonylcarbamoyl transferase component Bud32